MNLDVSIILPDKVFLRETAKEIIMSTLTGQIGILKDHIPILSGLDIGTILIKTSDKKIALVTTGGFALVNDNKITILVNEAEFSSNITIEEAKEALSNAKKNFDSISIDSAEKLKANIQLKKARARLQVFDQIQNFCYIIENK
jgi:ATP synthase F1 epsilon subunit